MEDNICLENDNWKRSYPIRMHNEGSFEGVTLIDGAIIVWIKAIDIATHLTFKDFYFHPLTVLKIILRF